MRVDMECPTRLLVSGRSEQFRYKVEHEKRNCIFSQAVIHTLINTYMVYLVEQVNAFFCLLYTTY